MNIVKKYPVFGSSVNPEKVGLTAKGVAIGLIPLVILILRAFGYEITEIELIELVEAIAAVSSVAAVMIGLTRKIAVKLKQQK